MALLDTSAMESGVSERTKGTPFICVGPVDTFRIGISTSQIRVLDSVLSLWPGIDDSSKVQSPRPGRNMRPHLTIVETVGS